MVVGDFRRQDERRQRHQRGGELARPAGRSTAPAEQGECRVTRAALSQASQAE
jgi:hypothetical protein